MLSEDLTDLVLRIHRRLRQEEAVHGITGARLATLRELVETGPLPIGELAARQRVSPPTMSRVVDALEAGKLVVRRRARHDGRVIDVTPTSLGRSLVVGSGRHRLRWVEAFLSGLTAEERSTVGAAVHILDARMRDSPDV